MTRRALQLAEEFLAWGLLAAWTFEIRWLLRRGDPPR